MNISAVSIDSSTADGRPALVAWGVACVLTLALIAAGILGSTPLPVLGCAGAFLFFAVASDVNSHRIPNLLTLPAILGALLVSPWLGATSGPVEAAIGAALGFGLLVGPYAVGGVGAGDVKALMALGAWIGPSATLGAVAWAMLAAGALGLVVLTLRWELLDFAKRWGRSLITTLTLRRLAYEPPPLGSAAARGIPFAAALAIGLAAQWSQGSPW
jgi:prepilin peptidase CpaA